jgi:integrase
MARPKTGSVRCKRGVWYVRIPLRSGKRWEHPVPPRADGKAPDEKYAIEIRDGLMDAYRRRTWDPEAPKPKAAPAPEVPTVLEHARAWIGRQTFSSLEEHRGIIDRYITRAPLGGMKLDAVRPATVLEFVRWLQAQPSKRGGTLAPKTVHSVYNVVKRVFDDAVFHEILPHTPCVLLPGSLPRLEDKNPTARAGWIFDRAAAQALVYSPALPEDHRVEYAVSFFTGARRGEVYAARWRDWDESLEPLGRLSFLVSIERRTRAEKQTKTGVYKHVPVHPRLAAILKHWREHGWQATYGRAPRADDLLLPTADGETPRSSDNASKMVRRDCARLGVRYARAHDMRATFVSMLQDDGGDIDKVRRLTHPTKRNITDVYTRLAWATLCREVAKLGIQPPPAGPAGPVPPGSSGTIAGPDSSPLSVAAETLRRNQRARQDSKLPMDPAPDGIRQDVAGGGGEGLTDAGGSGGGLGTPVPEPILTRGDAIADLWGERVHAAEWGAVADSILLGPGGDA